jgi:ABC-2 type transport system permease protein
MVLSRCALYFLICMVWNRIWLVSDLSAIDLPFAVSHQQLIQYVLVTEWVVAAVGYGYRAVAAAIQSSQVFCLLTRPIGYLGFTLASHLGELLWGIATIGGMVLLCSLLFVGTLPLPTHASLLTLLSVLLGCGIALLLQLSIGVAAAWLGEVAPLHWGLQKTLFVLGGLMMPVFFYPLWVQWLAWATPFPAMLYLPAVAATGQTTLSIWQILGIQLLWLAGLGVLTVRLFGRAEDRLVGK